MDPAGSGQTLTQSYCMSLHPCDVEQALQATIFLRHLFDFVDDSSDSKSSAYGSRFRILWSKLSSSISDPIKRQELVGFYSAPGRLEHAFGHCHIQSTWIGSLCRVAISNHGLATASPVLGVPYAWFDAMAGDLDARHWDWIEYFLHGQSRRSRRGLGDIALWRRLPIIFWDKERVELLKQACTPYLQTGWLKERQPDFSTDR